jgi:hypothetical protein
MSIGGGEAFEEPGGGADGFGLAVGEGMDGGAADDGFAAEGVIDLDFKAEFSAAGDFDGGGDFEQIVVAGTAEEFEVGFDEGEEDAAGFEVGVGHAELAAHEFGAAAFKPFEGAGVVEGAHLVRFAVTDAQLEAVRQPGHGGRMAESAADFNPRGGPVGAIIN